MFDSPLLSSYKTQTELVLASYLQRRKYVKMKQSY